MKTHYENGRSSMSLENASIVICLNTYASIFYHYANNMTSLTTESCIDIVDFRDYTILLNPV